MSEPVINTAIDVSFDPTAGAIVFTPSVVLVPYTDGSTPYYIELNTDPLYPFKKIVVWTDLPNGTVAEIPVPYIPQVYALPEKLDFGINNFSSSRLVIKNVNKNTSASNITIHIEVTIEHNSILYISKDPQVIDEKETGSGGS